MKTSSIITLCACVASTLTLYAATEQWKWSVEISCGSVKTVIADGKGGCAAIVADSEQTIVVWLGKDGSVLYKKELKDIGGYCSVFPTIIACNTKNLVFSYYNSDADKGYTIVVDSKSKQEQIIENYYVKCNDSHTVKSMTADTKGFFAVQTLYNESSDTYTHTIARYTYK